jgi:hypothetical protein
MGGTKMTLLELVWVVKRRWRLPKVVHGSWNFWLVMDKVFVEELYESRRFWTRLVVKVQGSV